MKKGMIKAVAFILCIALIIGEGSIVYATQGLEGNGEAFEEHSEESEVLNEESLASEKEEFQEDSSTEESLEEENEDISEEVSQEPVEEVSEQMEDISEDEPSQEDDSEEMSGNSEETVSVESVAEESELFDGLPDYYVMTSEDMENKAKLRENVDSVLDGKEGINYVENEILVYADSLEEAEMFAEAFNGSLSKYVERLAVIKLNTGEDEPVLSVKQAVTAAADVNSKLPAAWPNTIHQFYTSADPALDPFSSVYQWQHDMLNSEDAWKAGYDGTGVKVAVLDTGIRLGHEDFDWSKVVTYCTSLDKEEELNKYRPNNPLVISEDDLYVGHGTHVNGIIAAQRNNNKGGAGIAPNVELYSCNIFTPTVGAAADDIYEGIYWAIEQEVDIVNMSFGTIEYNQYVADAVKDAYEHGIMMFAAAGNVNSNSDHYPACYEGAISIAAIEETGAKTYFSSYGSKVRYAFPGDSIYSTVSGIIGENGDVTSLTTDSYCEFSGTSMASPAAAAAAAITIQYARENNLIYRLSGPDKVNKLLSLMDAASITPSQKNIGKGCVNLAKLVGVTTIEEAPKMPELIYFPGGTYLKSSLEIALAPVENADIIYTTDNTVPSVKNGELQGSTRFYDYYNGIIIEGSRNVTLKAVAVNMTTGQTSPVLTQKYVLKPDVRSVNAYNKENQYVVSQGGKLTLKADCYPDYAVCKKIEWFVDLQPKGITVKNGVVSVSKNAKPGVYGIVAIATNGTDDNTDDTYDYVEIEVIKSEKKVSSIKSEKLSYVINENEDYRLQPIKVESKDNSVKCKDLLWTVSDTDIIESYIDDGNLCVYGKREGKTKLTGKALDGSNKKIVLNIEVVGTGVLKGNIRIPRGKSATYKAVSYNGKNISNKLLTWKVAPEGKGVTVANGKVKVAKDAGIQTYTVTATRKDNDAIQYVTEIKVVSGSITKLEIPKSSQNIILTRCMDSDIGVTSARVAIKMEGSGATSDNWRFDTDTSLIDCSKKGNILTINAGGYCGSTTINLYSVDGSNKKAQIKVDVVNPASRMKLSYPTGRCANLAYGKTMKLIPYFGKDYGVLTKPEKTIEWSSSSPDIIAVDENGKVTAKHYSGTAVITAKSAILGVEAQMQITATDIVTRVEIVRSEILNESGTRVKYYNYANDKDGYLYLRMKTKHGGNVYIEDCELYFDSLNFSTKGAGVGINPFLYECGLEGEQYYAVFIAYTVNHRGTHNLLLDFKDGNTTKTKFTFKYK